MESTIKSLLAKSWKNEDASLAPGKYQIEETITIRVHGTVQKLDDELAAPTVSIPLISTLAYFWDRLGIDRDAALGMLREALHEAMSESRNQDSAIKSRMDDVQTAIKAIRQELIADLPKMRREGKTLLDGLRVDVLALGSEVEERIAA